MRNKQKITSFNGKLLNTSRGEGKGEISVGAFTWGKILLI